MRTQEASIHQTKWVLGMAGALIAVVVFKTAYGKLMLVTGASDELITGLSFSNFTGLFSAFVICATQYALLKERSGLNVAKHWYAASMLMSVVFTLGFIVLAFTHLSWGEFVDHTAMARANYESGASETLAEPGGEEWRYKLYYDLFLLIPAWLGCMIIGGLQWLVLRLRVKHAGAWFRAVAISGLLALVLGKALSIGAQFSLGDESEIQAFITRISIMGAKGALIGWFLSRAAWRMLPKDYQPASIDVPEVGPFGKLRS